MNAAPGFEPALIWALATFVAVAVVVPYLVGFRRRRRLDRARLVEAKALGIDRPTAQFPFIDPEHCIGCGACVRACPEGDVLGVVGGVAVVINGLRCVGHGRCADACPVGAIEIGLGDLKGRPDVPILTREQESTVPGIFVAGELSGLALIRNAVEQGATVARTVARRLSAGAGGSADPDAVDLLVVGAGPAGVAAALAAREAGLTARVVDQAAGLGGTILHFPRRKMVLTQPVQLPGGGELAHEEYTKEELLELLSERIASRRLDVRFGERLATISGAFGGFVVTTSAAAHRARYVVLALGRRGTPRKLGVPGEERDKVMYQLRDAESYRRQRILVVGGGDSAIEAAVGLARQAGNRVTLSYRKLAFHRIKKKNQTAVESMSARGKIDVLFDSEVVEIEEDRVTLRVGNETRTLENDHVFAFAGGEPPYRLLETLGVRFGGDPERRASAAPRAVAGLFAALALLAVPLAAQQNPHGEISITCESCHTTADWKVVRKDVKFDHATTGFPLLGSHALLNCSQCHTDKVFRHVATACADCHKDAHRGELGLDCAACHDTRGWDVRSDFYAAHSKTLMPLLAGHAKVDCDACHTMAPPRQYSGVPTDCVACHRADYLAASTPAHGAVPRDCVPCHGPTAQSWSRAAFQHPARFPLSGAHASLACVDCHKGPAGSVSPDCYSCHRADYEATRDPNHVAANISTQCAACHTTSSWTSAVFDHSTSGFPLDGAHRSTPCGSCHSQGYAGTPRDCYSCHRADYAATTDPNHAGAGFPTTCQNCHTTASWSGAAFDHSQTFPLTGAHATTECAACHRNGYAGTPRDCVSCHRADYDATRDPNHAAAGFPTTCQSCHTTSSWEGASFDHDARYFPIYSGTHRGRWSACSDCHVVAGNFQAFECTTCHGRSSTDSHHQEVGGYRYESSACYSCHPDGRAGD